MHKSITSRYFYSTAALLLCSITIMGFIQMYLSTGYFGEEKNDALKNTIDNVVMLTKEVSEDTSLTKDEQMAMLKRELTITSRVSESLILLTDAAGKPILADEGNKIEFGNRLVPQKVLDYASQSGNYKEIGTLGGLFPRRFYVVGCPLTSQGGVTQGYVFAATDAENLSVYLSDMFSSFILSAGLMLLVSCVISILITSHTTTPLRRIAEAAKKFGNGDLAARVPVEGDDEVAQLALTFNNMASSLEKTDYSRRSFMGNIAHELRTPMTSIKGFVDGMIDGTVPPQAHAHYLGIVSDEVGRLSRLIKNMLDITKLEAGEYKVSASHYDIWETITGVVFGAEQRLEANKINVEGLCPNKQTVYADSDLVYQVVYNLVDNAIKFCEVGGEVRFSVTQSKGMVTVGIRNSGQGIANEALPFVFDRFYKEDKSRGLNTTGSGLGLHICKVLIKLSGGNIWAESKENEYCEFLFTLPVDKAAEKSAPHG